MQYAFTFFSPKVSVCLSPFDLFSLEVKFCEWTNFPYFRTICTLVKSKFHMDIISEGSNYLHVFFEFFLCFTCQLHIDHVKKCDTVVLVVCSSYPVLSWSTALWGGLSKYTIAMVIKSLLELFHVIFPYLLFILNYCCSCCCFWLYVSLFLLQIFYAVLP